MRLPGRKKAEDEATTMPGPASAALEPSIAANVVPGVPLPGWAVYTLQSNAVGGPSQPPVGAAWGAADPDYITGQEYMEAADPDLSAGAYAVAQTSVLAAWEASWEWQQEAGPSPQDLLTAAAQDAVAQPDGSAEEGQLQEDLAPAPTGVALPVAGLDIPVAEPEFLVDQPPADNGPLPEPVVESNVPVAVTDDGALPVEDDGDVLPLAVEDEALIFDADAVLPTDAAEALVDAGESDPIPLAVEDDTPLAVLDDELIPVAYDDGADTAAAPSTPDTPWTVDGIAIPDSDADVDMDPAAAASAPPPPGAADSELLPDADIPTSERVPPPPLSDAVAEPRQPPARLARSAGPAFESKETFMAAPEGLADAARAVPRADEPPAGAAEEMSQTLAEPPHAPAGPLPDDEHDGADVQVDDDLWQALAMAAEEAGRIGSADPARDDAAQHDTDRPDDENPPGAPTFP